MENIDDIELILVTKLKIDSVKKLLRIRFASSAIFLKKRVLEMLRNLKETTLN